MRTHKIFAHKSRNNIDTSFLFLVLSILFFGIFILYDATVIYSKSVSGEAYKFVLLQLGWYSIGLFLFWVFSRLDYKKIDALAYVFFVLSIFFLVVLAFVGMFRQLGVFECVPGGFVPCINGASRWFYFNPSPLPSIPVIGIVGFQPSELAKFSLVLYLAVQLEKLIEGKKSTNLSSAKKDTFMFGVVVSVIISILILLQPNMSTAVMVLVLGFIMLYVSGVSVKPFLVLVPGALMVGLFGMMASSYRRLRLLTFLKGDVESCTNLAECYHIRQIMIALGSGGFFGVGIGQSIQKFQYIPEIASDSIFAIVGEELGFIGTTVLIGVFGMLLVKCLKIAENSTDLRAKLLVVGVTTWIIVQFSVNVAAMTHLIPLTGVPMPLISYGGSSVVFILMGLGVVANISRHR